MTKTNAASTFEDLVVYQVAREFRKAMYRVARQLPDVEKFVLASQMRRAALSLTNNIAEGHGRYHYLDQIKFTLQSRGSLEELIDDLNTCEDEQYLPVNGITPQSKKAGDYDGSSTATYVICASKRIPNRLRRSEKLRLCMAMLQIWRTIHESRFNESR